MAVQRSALSANAASLASAIAVETSVAGGNARSAAAASASASAAAVSAIAAASSADVASASIAVARASLSDAAATLTASAKVVSASSVEVAASASVVSDRSVAIDAASSSLDSKVDSITKSFAQVSSQLDASQVALASSTSVLGISLAAVQSTADAQATTAAALAASAAVIASQTSSLAAQATATGIATACQLGKFLGNGHCYNVCPTAYPVQFSRTGTFGLCCTEGAQECVNASPTGATVCNDKQDYLLTILDSVTQSGTCTKTCSTTTGSAETSDLVSYAYKQLGGVYAQCVKAADCEHKADPTSLLCCAEGAATCASQAATGAESCTDSLFFNVLDSTATPPTGSCGSACTGSTSFYSNDNQCLTACPTATAFFTTDGAKRCCADSNAATCSSKASLTCNTGSVLDTANGVCVTANACPNGAKDNGSVCCPDGALTCTDATKATSCGVNHAGVQTFLTADATCVVDADCANEVGTVLTGNNAVCCADPGATACSSEAAAHATACDASSEFYLSQTVAGTNVGTCNQYCADGAIETVGANAGLCVAACSSGSYYPKTITLTSTIIASRKRGPTSSLVTEQICCPANAASCTSQGVTTCNTNFFLQADGTCSTGCTAPSVKSSSGGFCCPAGTKTCSGNGAHDATACQSDYYMLDNTCLATCPVNTVAATDSNGIKICSCIGTSFSSCAFDGSAKGCTNNLDLVASASGGPATCQSSCFPTDYTIVAALGPSWEGVDVGGGGLAGCKAHCQAKGGEEAYGAWSPDNTYTHTFCTCYTTAPEAGGPVSPVDMAQCGDRDPTDNSLPMGSFVNNRASVYLL